MGFSIIHSILLILSVANGVLCFPYRSLPSRSVPGTIRSSSEADNFKDYLASYVEMVQQQQQQRLQNHHQQQSLPYPLPEYEPVYQQGYISRRPQISAETIAAILPYLSQSELEDYSEDYPASSSYQDDDGTWYDDSASPDFLSSSYSRDKKNQEAALLQLFLDHIAGKYSLEDLETLERQAAIEDNSENQLQALMPRKKSGLAMLSTRPKPQRNYFSARKGQKEEPLMLPASSVRKPVFARSPISLQKWAGRSTTETPTSLPTPTTTASSETEVKQPKRAKISAIKGMPSREAPSSTLPPSTTMEPAVKSAYEAFKSYLDQERYLRKAADDAKHFPQKRFVSEPQSLTQQLESLKKTIT